MKLVPGQYKGHCPDSSVPKEQPCSPLFNLAPAVLFTLLYGGMMKKHGH